MLKRWFGLLLLSFFLAVTAPACKKKGEAAEGDAVAEQDDDEEDGKKKKKKKKKKKRKGKKGKKKKGKKSKTDKKGPSDADKEGKDSSKSLVPSPPATDKGEAARGSLKTPPAGDGPAVVDRGKAPNRRVDAASPGDLPAKTADRGSPRSAASRGVTPPPVKVSATKYVSVADITQRLPEKGWVSYGPIPGVVPGENYNSVIYRRPGTSRFVSAQVWDFGTYAEAVEKWNEQLGTYPNASEQEGLFSDLAFFSYRNQTTNLTFVEADHAIVISVTCHTESCDDTSLYELAKTAYIRAH